MTTYTVRKNQSLRDITVQNYGSRWLEGLLSIIEHNDVSLADELEAGTELVIEGVDENDLSLQYLKARGIEVVSGNYVAPIPETPSMFTTAESDPTTIVLSWSSQSLVFYVLERSTDNSIWQTIATLAQTSYEDELPSAGIYYYRLKATSSGQDSGYAYTCSRPFTSVWQTDRTTQHSTSSTRLRLPILLGETRLIWVDWGDGTEPEYYDDPDTYIEKDYGIAGEYTVKMWGTYHFSFQVVNGTWVDNQKIELVEKWGDLRIQSHAFHACHNFNFTATDLPVLVSLFNSFSSCSGLQGNDSINDWDVGHISNFQFLFNASVNFNPYIPDWNMQSATVMNHSFRNSDFDQDLSNWSIINLVAASSFLQDSQLSTANYDNTLISWAAQNVKNNLIIHFGTSKYTLGGAAEAARTSLINDHNWTITDGGGI